MHHALHQSCARTHDSVTTRLLDSTALNCIACQYIQHQTHKRGQDTNTLLVPQVGKLQSVFASAEAFPVSEAAPPRPSGLRFASGHPFGALRGYRSSSSTGDGSSLSSGAGCAALGCLLSLHCANRHSALSTLRTVIMQCHMLPCLHQVSCYNPELVS